MNNLKSVLTTILKCEYIGKTFSKVAILKLILKLCLEIYIGISLTDPIGKFYIRARMGLFTIVDQSLVPPPAEDRHTVFKHYFLCITVMVPQTHTPYLQVEAGLWPKLWSKRSLAHHTDGSVRGNHASTFCAQAHLLKGKGQVCLGR